MLTRKRLSYISLLFLFAAACFQFSCRPEIEQQSLAARARKIHDRVLTVDTHCDTAFRLLDGSWDISVRHEPGGRASGQIDLPRMAEGGLDAEFFAVFVGQGERTEQGYAEAKKSAIQSLAAIRAMCDKYPSLVGLALTPDDAYRLEKAGLRAAFIGMENGYPIGKDLALLDLYAKRGIRYLTLVHSADNDICDSSTDRQRKPGQERGLTAFGREVVAACNRLGVMIDVSHM